MNDRAPICCTAYQTCSEVINITIKVPNNDNFINNIGFRCDGYEGCQKIENNIIYLGNNKGDLYFTSNDAIGRFSGYNTIV